MDYIHQNPVTALVVANAEDYLHSSANVYAGSKQALVKVWFMRMRLHLVEMLLASDLDKGVANACTVILVANEDQCGRKQSNYRTITPRRN